MTGAQAPLARVPLADGSLVATAQIPPDDLIPSLLAASDVLGTGWYAADAAGVKSGSTVAVVSDGAVGLKGVLAAKQMGAARVISMSRHKSRQELAIEFGATVSDRGEAGVARIKELTNGIGADATLQCVGTAESTRQALQCTRPARNDRLCRRAAWSAARRPIPVLCASRHAGRASAGPPLPAAPDRPCPEPLDQSWQGVRSNRAAGGRGRRLPRHGRASRDQDLAPRVTGRTEINSGVAAELRMGDKD